jgi:signal transduction histidine kinase
MTSLPNRLPLEPHLWEDEADDNQNAQLPFLLAQIANHVPYDLACVYVYDSNFGRLELLANAESTPLDLDSAEQIQNLLEAYIATLTKLKIILPARDLDGTRFQSALVIPLVVSGELIGLLALFAAAQRAYTPGDGGKLRNWVSLLRTALDNHRLRENQSVALAIQYMALVIGENPSPQDLIDKLHEHLYGPHITTSVMLLYGPRREDRPNGPFDYVEVRGLWSKRRGSGIGLGLRLYLQQYPDMMAQLEERKVIAVSSLREIENRLDPLIRGFLRAERIHSMILIPLHAAQRRLGALLIATDRTYQFPPHELRGYQTVSEFLAMSAMAQVLQQQHDFVQRGRAALLDAVTDGVMMVLPNAGGPHVLTVNQTFTRMFNLAQSRAQGLSLSQVLDRMQIPQDVVQELRRQWMSVPVSDPSTPRGEFNMMHPEGFSASIEWYSAPVYQENRVLGRIYTFHDVSAARAAANLRANFLSRVSHELRTPLTSIQGFAQFILESSGDALPKVAREYTEIILRSARHLNLVFSDIIEIARADTGRMPLNLETVSLIDVIQQAVKLLEPQSRARGQIVVINADPNLPDVRIDMSRIIQVLSNLISNAIKYAPKDTTIHISTQHITTPQLLSDGAPPDVVIPHVLVTVTDEGAGLSVEDADQVFLSFYRTKEANASKIEGTGLGLAIARSIIELHRGKIWAEPRKRGRRGARFLFTLPTAEQ